MKGKAGFRLIAAESQRRLRLPNLTNNMDASTNLSQSMKKEKRSQSTLRGGTYSRVTLNTNSNSVATGAVGYLKDSSLATI